MLRRVPTVTVVISLNSLIRIANVYFRALVVGWYIVGKSGLNLLLSILKI